MKSNPLQNREKCNIAILEISLSMRQICADALKMAGFKSILPFLDEKLFTEAVQKQEFDWCILNLENLTEVENIPKYIENLYLMSKKSSLLISIIYDEKEISVLPALFELGILSSFSKAVSVESMSEQINTFLKLFELYKWNDTLVAAEYIRLILKQKNSHASLLKLEESLLDLFPGNALCLLKLAEAQCLNNKLDIAANTIAQAEFIDPTLKPLATILQKKFFPDRELETVSGQKNIFGIQSCIIVDPDTDVQHYLAQTMQKLGITKCQSILDGEAAFKYFSENSEPSLVLMEWRLPIVPGIALIQRIRKLGFHQCYIVIMSSLIKKSELPLLQETGIDAVLEKPFDVTKLSEVLTKIVRRSRNPSEPGPLEKKIRTLLASDEISEAEKMIGEYCNIPLVSEGSKLQIRAEYEYFTKNYHEACQHTLGALNLLGESVLLVALLGKCFLKLKDFKNAQQAFERAHALSPANVDRILTLINLKIESGAGNEADTLLEEAKKVDSTSTDVMEMECRLAIQNSDTKTASHLLNTLDSLSGVVGMINNDAVTKIRSNQFDDGIKLYQEALKSLPVDSSANREFITYNLSLAFARNGELDKCLVTLNSISISPTAKIFPKFNSLLSRVKSAFESGTKLELLDLTEKTSSNDSVKLVEYGTKFEDIMKKVEVKKGERCCYKIYFNEE